MISPLGQMPTTPISWDWLSPMGTNHGMVGVLCFSSLEFMGTGSEKGNMQYRSNDQYVNHIAKQVESGAGFRQKFIILITIIVLKRRYI